MLLSNLIVNMKASLSIASSHSSLSQEVLHPKDYDPAEISQFSAFWDDWSLDQADELQLH